MTIADDLHEALAHYGLVQETDPFPVCSTDYRSKLEQAMDRCDIDNVESEREELQHFERKNQELREQLAENSRVFESLLEERNELKARVEKLERAAYTAEVSA